MKTFKVFIFYPFLFAALAGFASAHRYFMDHRMIWGTVIVWILFATVWIPYMFMPYYKDLQSRKAGKEAKQA